MKQFVGSTLCSSSNPRAILYCLPSRFDIFSSTFQFSRYLLWFREWAGISSRTKAVNGHICNISGSSNFTLFFIKIHYINSSFCFILIHYSPCFNFPHAALQNCLYLFMTTHDGIKAGTNKLIYPSLYHPWLTIIWVNALHQVISTIGTSPTLAWTEVEILTKPSIRISNPQPARNLKTAHLKIRFFRLKEGLD